MRVEGDQRNKSAQNNSWKGSKAWKNSREICQEIYNE